MSLGRGELSPGAVSCQWGGGFGVRADGKGVAGERWERVAVEGLYPESWLPAARCSAHRWAPPNQRPPRQVSTRSTESGHRTGRDKETGWLLVGIDVHFALDSALTILRRPC